jgi:hypothetical protein
VKIVKMDVSIYENNDFPSVENSYQEEEYRFESTFFFISLSVNQIFSAIHNFKVHICIEKKYC